MPVTQRRLDPETGHIWEYSEEEGWKRTTGPEEELGAFGAFQLGAHLGARRLFRGAQSLGASAAGLGPEAQEIISRRQAAENELLAPVAERYPIASAIGGITPELATGVLGGTGLVRGGASLLSRPLAGTRAGSTMAEQALIGAGIGGLRHEERLSDRVFAAATGAVGGALGFQVGRMADRVRRQISAYARGGAEGDINLRTAGRVSARGESEGRIEAGPAETVAERTARARAQQAELEGQPNIDRLDQELPGPTRDLRVREAEEMGFELTPGMRAGRGPIAKIEAGAESMPGLSGVLDGVRARNYSRLQNYIARAIGVPDATDLGMEVLEQAQTGITRQMDSVLDAVDQAGGIPAREIRNAADDALEELSGLGRDLPGRQVVQEVNQALEELGEEGVLNGLTARRWRTYLNRRFRAFSASEGDEASADLVRQLMEGFDDAIERRVPQELRGTYRHAREQWRMLVALRRGVGVRDDGMLNLRTFANSVKKVFRTEYRGRDQGLSPEMRDAIRATRAMSAVAPAFPDSGTATRLAPQMALNAPGRTAALMFGTNLLGDAYAATSGRMGLNRTAAALGPVWPAAPTAAGAVGRALATTLDDEY